MFAQRSACPNAKHSEIPVETMRALAVILLVSYHVIGASPQGGLKIDYPHGLRVFADFFVDVRMPLFAFIAGFVYALRPPKLSSFSKFMIGKLRRLFVPGVVAAVTFFIVAYLIDNRFAKPLSEAWRPVVYSYAHYWFLQSILVIFVVFGLIDAVLSRRFTVALLVVSCAVYLSGFKFGTRLFSVNGAIYLLPYFLLGIVSVRHKAVFFDVRLRLTSVLIVLSVACTLWNFGLLSESGKLSLARRDYHSLVFGLSLCSLLLMWCPRFPALEHISPFAFTIYLYHVFGTVAARKLSGFAGVSQIEVLFLIGVLGGLILPIALHLVIERTPVLDRLVLGRKRARQDDQVQVAQPTRAGPLPELDLVRDRA